jgi:hypothetical protein
MPRYMTVDAARCHRETPDWDADWWLGRDIRLDDRWHRVVECQGYRVETNTGRTLSMGVLNEQVEMGRIEVR